MLPPRLFVDNVNLGEVEFPIYFNFFIKKAFQNPDLRGPTLPPCLLPPRQIATKVPLPSVVMIGSEDQLRRLRASFQESVFGPEAQFFYIVSPAHACPFLVRSANLEFNQNEEIGEAKKAEGYDIDLWAETSYLRFKGLSGPLTETCLRHPILKL